MSRVDSRVESLKMFLKVQKNPNSAIRIIILFFYFCA